MFDFDAAVDNISNKMNKTMTDEELKEVRQKFTMKISPKLLSSVISH